MVVRIKGQGQGRLDQKSQESLGLRELATRLDSPVLAISSLSRGVNNYADPTLEALKESVTWSTPPT